MSEPRRARPWSAPALLFAALIALLAAAPTSADAAEESRPNVVVVVTDDQPVGSFDERFMPETFKHFVAPGTDFRQFIVATPLCCPSRAALLTGQYGHNNGVLVNQYSRLIEPDNVLPAWLRDAGYKTMHVGRFFNGYGFAGRKSEVAPGWKLWRTAVEPHSYYDYRMRFNNRFRQYGSADRAYLTSTFNRIAAGLIRRHADRRAPFYLQLDHFAPHQGGPSRTKRCGNSAPVPGPADELAYGRAPLPRPPSFNEGDLSDKPQFLQDGLAPISDVAELRRQWRCQLASLREVDRGIGDLWRALRETGSLADTAVIFTSDNGFFYGEHRIEVGKHYPYEEALRVPLAVRLPKALTGGRQPGRSQAPVANIDLAPTILDLAGAEPCWRGGCRTMDGRSLLADAEGRRAIPADRGIAVEYDGETPVEGLVCEYQGIRTTRALLVEHIRARSSEEGSCDQDTGAVEHYDLSADPFELDSLFPAAPGSTASGPEAELTARSRALADCAGIAGRDPLPPSGNYCE